MKKKNQEHPAALMCDTLYRCTGDCSDKYSGGKVAFLLLFYFILFLICFSRALTYMDGVAIAAVYISFYDFFLLL